MLQRGLQFFSRSLILLASCLLVSCATENSMYYSQGPDPMEKFNRNTYRLNDTLDHWFFKPLASGYNYVFPGPVREAISNMYDNINNPISIANDLLQGHFYWTMNDFWRLVINSTVGIGGLFDVASHMGLRPHYNDFGLTFRSWGAKPLSYVMLPILGPSDVGSFVGLVPDYIISPWYYPLARYPMVKYPVYLIKGVSVRGALLEHEDLAQQLSLDPYIFMRSAYYQYGNRLMKINNHPPLPAEPIEKTPIAEANETALVSAPVTKGPAAKSQGGK